MPTTITHLPGVTILRKESGIHPTKFMAQQRAYLRKIQPTLEKLSADTSRQMKTIIEQNKKRPGQYKKDSLANAFKAGRLELTQNSMVFGIGDKTYLDQEFPYWYVVDVGGYIPPSVMGWFGRHRRPIKGTKGGKEVFHQHSMAEGGFFMKPKVPIRPMNYISLTQDWINRKWKQVWGSYFRAFKVTGGV